MPTPLHQRLRATHQRLDDAALKAERNPVSIALMLATKTQTSGTIRAAVLAHRDLVAAGEVTPRALHIGENRVQELSAKAPDLQDLHVTAHLIGPLQSNKINHTLRALALHKDGSIDTVDTTELATRLDARWDGKSPLPVMIQVNTSGETTKSGTAPANAFALAQHIDQLPNLALRGFMTIARRSTDPDTARNCFTTLARVREKVHTAGNGEGLILSMGMSNDLESAVACGADIVRIGTSVFGERQTLA